MDSEVLEEFRYARFGHIPQGRKCDGFASRAYNSIPGDLMPPRWTKLPPEEFQEKYGPGIRWSKTAHYHLLIVNGHPVMRLWTNTNAYHTWVDVPDLLVHQCRDIPSKDIPPGSYKKRGPMTKALCVTTLAQLDHLLLVIKRIYGLGNT